MDIGVLVIILEKVNKKHFMIIMVSTLGISLPHNLVVQYMTIEINCIDRNSLVGEVLLEQDKVTITNSYSY